MGMNEFLCMFFLDRGTLYRRPDGRSWKDLCRGWLGSCVIRLAFLLTAWLWSTGNWFWVLPVFLLPWLMIRESFDFFLTEVRENQDVMWQLLKCPVWHQSAWVSSAGTVLCLFVHRVCVLGEGQVGVDICAQVSKGLYLLNCQPIQPQRFKERLGFKMFASLHNTAPWSWRCWAPKSSLLSTASGCWPADSRQPERSDPWCRPPGPCHLHTSKGKCHCFCLCCLCRWKIKSELNHTSV